ncbi:unnamed protein product [Pseudo-nitzschia multistriata]|uniref:Uncharacterized protein n=1 Tax=Pseudo-nitzschia multistriata TaxID=183589 RepID=A0A448Z7J7_9STRA|nr:unnamed protein product [Pseudo-nitzschia multistriata]
MRAYSFPAPKSNQHSIHKLNQHTADQYTHYLDPSHTLQIHSFDHPTFSPQTLSLDFLVPASAASNRRKKLQPPIRNVSG